MSKAVLISIKPQWCGQIAQLRKTMELRKTRPNIELPFKAYIYCTNVKSMNLQDYIAVDRATCGAVDAWSCKVIGEFTCFTISTICHVSAMGSNALPKLHLVAPGLRYKPADTLLQAACLTEDAAETYLKGGDGFGWGISNLILYSTPKPLSDFGLSRAPQSWCYVEERSSSE